MAELITEQGFGVIKDPEARLRLMDELGDAWFTATWLFSAGGGGFTETKISDAFTTDFQILERMRGRMAGLRESYDVLEVPFKAAPSQRAMMDAWQFEMVSRLLGGFICLGKISNCWKKIRWQFRTPSVDIITTASKGLISCLECVCALVGITPEMCVKSNVKKIDRRFPDGWRPGGGQR